MGGKPQVVLFVALMLSVLAVTGLASVIYGHSSPMLQAQNGPVLEPWTMMLLGAGLVGLAGWGRKKFRK